MDKQIIINDLEELADVIFDWAEEGKDIAVALNYGDAVELFAYLCTMGFLPLYGEFEPPEFDGYNKEYYLTATSDGELSLDKSFVKTEKNPEGVYFSTASDIMLFFGDVSSKIYFANHDADIVYEVVYSDECEIEDNDFEDDNYPCHDEHYRDGDRVTVCTFEIEEAEDFYDLVDYIFEHFGI